MSENSSVSTLMRPEILAVFPALLCIAFSLHAQTNQATRPISLKEAIQLALENNYEIAVERYEPQIAAFQIGEWYGDYYDPIFRLPITYEKVVREGEFDSATQRQLGEQETETDRIGSTRVGDPVLGGILLPTGLRYEIFAEYEHRTGRRFDVVGEHDIAGLEDISIFGFEDSDQYISTVGIRLEQPLLRDSWIDDGRRQIKLRKKELKMSEHRLLFTVMDVVRQVQGAYYALIQWRETVKARQKGVELAESLLAEIRKRIKAGTLAPLDGKQAESETALRRTELIDAERQVTAQENVLKNLISNQYQQWQAVSLVPTEVLLAIPHIYDLQESWASALELRPDYHELKEALERENIEVKYHHNQLFPHLNLVGTYGRRGFDELTYTNRVEPAPGGPIIRRVPARDASFSRTLHDLREEVAPFYSFGVVLSFPLTFTKERHNYGAAKARREQAKVALAQLQQNILVGVEDAIKEAQAAHASVQAARESRESAEVALEAEEEKLENNRSTSFNVLQLQEDLTDRRALEIQALARYNAALSMLYFLEGRILERNGVNVELAK